MKKIIVYLFCAFAYCSFSQSEKGIEIGVQFSTVLETNANNGLVPSLLLKYKQHEYVFGARVGFQQINNLVNDSGAKRLIVNPDWDTGFKLLAACVLDTSHSFLVRNSN